MSDIREVGGPWQLPPSVSLIRVGDEWLMDDPARGSHRKLDALPGWLGQALVTLVSAGPLTSEQLGDVFTAAGVPAEHIDSCLRSFVEAGVLVGPAVRSPGR